MRRFRVPTVHFHFALCIGDDEDIDVATLLRGWRGRVLRRLGFTVAARWVLIHREPVDGPFELHIVPIGDGMSHDVHGDDCVCGPFALKEHHEYVADSWLFTHSSLDVREVAPTVEELEA